MIKNGAEVIHLATGMVVGYPIPFQIPSGCELSLEYIANGRDTKL